MAERLNVYGRTVKHAALSRYGHLRPGRQLLDFTTEPVEPAKIAVFCFQNAFQKILLTDLRPVRENETASRAMPDST